MNGIHRSSRYQVDYGGLGADGGLGTTIPDFLGTDGGRFILGVSGGVVLD